MKITTLKWRPLLSWLAVVSFSHIANNTKKISSCGVPSCVVSLLDLIVSNSNSMEGDLGKPLLTLFANDRNIWGGGHLASFLFCGSVNAPL